MMGPHWNPRATEIAVVLQGEGMVRIVGGSGTMGESKCQNMRFKAGKGDVFVVPRFHRMAQMSFNNDSFVFMGFSTVAKKNHPQFLAGKKSVLHDLDKSVLAASLNFTNTTTVDQFLASQIDSIILGCVSCAEEEERKMIEEIQRRREEEEARKREEEERKREEEERKREEEESRKREEEEREREEAREKEEERKREEEEGKEREEAREREDERKREEKEARRREVQEREREEARKMEREQEEARKTEEQQRAMEKAEEREREEQEEAAARREQEGREGKTKEEEERERSQKEQYRIIFEGRRALKMRSI